MNALVISGGGSKGAFAGGVAEYLMKVEGRQYDLFVGTSTGSLLIPSLASGQLDRVKKVYTTVKARDIFSVSPFIVRKRKGEYIVKMHHLNILRMFLKGRKTFGSSRALHKLIKKTFSQRDYDLVKATGKEIVVTVSNLTKHRVEYKSTEDYSYKNFCNWVWASANLLPFMSLYRKNGQDYGDGGFGNLIPIQEAINRGACNIDVIVLRPEVKHKESPPIRNAFNVLTRTYDFMMDQIGVDDLTIGKLAAANQQVDINFYYTPRILTEHSFIFDPEQMREWWKEGFEIFQKDGEPQPKHQRIEPLSPKVI